MGLLLGLAGQATPGLALDETQRSLPGGRQAVRWTSVHLATAPALASVPASAPTGTTASRSTSPPARPVRPVHPARPPRPVSGAGGVSGVRDARDVRNVPNDGAAAGGSSSFISVNPPPAGKDPVDLAFAPSGAEVAIANHDSDGVTFFDVATGIVNRTVAVGKGPQSVAITPDGRWVLTADISGNTVSAIDLASHTLIAMVPLSGTQPFAIRVTRDSRFAVVAQINDAKTSAFSVLDLSSPHEILYFPTPPQGAIGFELDPNLGIGIFDFTRFALTPDGSKIVLPLWANAAVAVFDRATGNPLGTVPVAPSPWDVDVSSDGAFALVGHEHDTRPGHVTRIDLATLRATAFPLQLDSFFQLNRITPDGRFAIVTGVDSVLFVDVRTGAVTATVPALHARDIAFTADGRAALLAPGVVLDLASQQPASQPQGTEGSLFRAVPSPVAPLVAGLDTGLGESVYLFDLGGAELVQRFAAPTGELPEAHAPRTVAVTPDGGTALVANLLTGNVAVIDLVAGALSGLIPIGETVTDLAITPDGAWGVATAPADGVVAVIDVAARAVAANVALPFPPARVLVAPGGRTAFAFQDVSSASGAVAVVALDGPASRAVSVTATVARAGNLGFAPYSVYSGVAVSAGGGLLAMGGAQNQLELVDTASMQDIARVPVGNFPVAVALSPDGSRAWVADALSNDVTVIQVGRHTARVQAVVGVPQPFDVYLDPGGAWVYVVSLSLDRPAVYVLDAGSNAVAAILDVPSAPGLGLGASRFLPGRSLLYLASTLPNPLRGVLTRIAIAGPGSRLLDQTPLDDLPFDLGVSADGLTFVAAQVALDGVDEVRFAPPAACAANAATLCLQQDRFTVTAAWQTAQGQSGTGQTQPLTAATGLFWFFAPDNLELVVKVVDGCAVTGSYWVFAGGLTDVQVALQVQDTATGAIRTYGNPAGTPFKPIQDTGAFASCP